MHTVNFSFDFIGLSEVFNVERDQRLNLPGYHDIVYRTRDDGRGGGGVGLFVKENISFRVRHDVSVFIPHIMESIFIEVLNEKGKTLKIVGTIYRPNTLPRADIEVFIETFCNILELVNSENKKCTLMGDMNI